MAEEIKQGTKCRAEKARERSRKWYLAHKVLVKERSRLWHTAHREQLRESKRVYRAIYPERSREAVAKWKKAHLELVRDIHRKWVAEHREQTRKYDHKYRKAHLAECLLRARKWRGKNPKRLRELCRKWDRAHAERSHEYHRNRRARKEKTEGTFTEQEWKILCNSYGNKCLACHRTDVVLTRDHVIPMGPPFFGTNFIWNIQPLCVSCNSKKHRRIDDYRFDHRFERAV